MGALPLPSTVDISWYTYFAGRQTKAKGLCKEREDGVGQALPGGRDFHSGTKNTFSKSKGAQNTPYPVCHHFEV